MNGVEVRHLDVGYRKTGAVLTGLDARARRGELTILIGSNGAGKSTLLRTLAGLQPALGGTITLDGADLLAGPVSARARRLAVVLTDRVEVGLLAGRELVALGRYPYTGAAGTLREADHAAVDEALRSVKAEHLAGRRMHELSDGERQRLLIARALAQEPSVLLLDEPSAWLDVSARVALLGLLRRLARTQNRAVVLSTHDLELALRLADHVWLIGAGRRFVTGSPPDLIGSGAIGEAFDTDDLAFDPATATFALNPPRE
ncbi:ABC transporter ATP-binding protein [Pseudonocardia spinosispora]|uniref:ABC transporter ATP-binding protein n=1 Tax=Pseudonocardia spinosispora TaxID=103441 RepID=UPI00042515FA|nr:ABC transporter ATP-binding protein [Pseudonocardia spinosispora]